MKIKFTEKQLQYLVENDISKEIAFKYLNDKNNETLWRCFHSESENSLFKYGYTSEYFGDGEGSLYGNGVYAFFTPHGAAKRVGTGGVGDKIMKCALVGGFKDFIILKKRLAIKYYGSDDIRVQLKHFFNEDIAEQIYNACIQVANSEGCGIVSDGWTGPIGRIVFGTGRSGRFKNLILKSKIKGIVYSGNNDPNATVIFNPRSVIPLAVTNEKILNGHDFLNWNYRISEDLTNKIDKFKDFYTIGEALKNKGIIQSYLKQPPRFNLLRVVLNNGKTSYYDIENQSLISKVGFDSIFVPEDDDNTVVIPFILKTAKGTAELYICKSENNYYVCKKSGQSNYNAVMTLEQYDKKFSNLNESYNNNQIPSMPRNAIGNFKSITGLNCHLEPVFHRTDNIKSCESICRTGFSPQYSTTEMYGHGIYTTNTLEACNRVLKGYGNYMILGFLKDGFKNFIIFNQELARRYYGEKCSIYDQFKSLVRPNHYDEMMGKYGELLKRENPQVLNDILLKRLERNHDIGKTNIRGVVVNFHSGGILAPIICDWKSVIPYAYSTNNGVSWTSLLDKDIHNSINKHKDALFAIQKLIADGIVKDTFKYNWSELKSHPQYINGYLRVELENGNCSFYSSEDEDLISYLGFPNAIGWNEDKAGNLKLDCTCYGQNEEEIPVRIYKIKGNYWICLKNQKGQYKPCITLEEYDG